MFLFPGAFLHYPLPKNAINSKKKKKKISVKEHLMSPGFQPLVYNHLIVKKFLLIFKS